MEWEDRMPGLGGTATWSSIPQVTWPVVFVPLFLKPTEKIKKLKKRPRQPWSPVFLAACVPFTKHVSHWSQAPTSAPVNLCPGE